MPEYGVTLTAANFRDTVQYKTSIDYDRTLNEPKKLLSDFASLFLDRLSHLDQTKWLMTFQILSQSIAEKQILVYAADPFLQRQVRDLGLSGEVKHIDGDYLSIIHSNVGGGKTDIKIKQTVDKTVSIATDGRAQVRLKITRTHEAFDEKFFPKNVDFMRILTPLGSRLVSASGFDALELLPSSREGAVSDPELAVWDERLHPDSSGMFVGEESGYTEFANWLVLSPGQTKTLELVYDLPFVMKTNYISLLQKQSGAVPFEFRLKVHFPGQIIYAYPSNLKNQNGALTISEAVAEDKVYGVIAQ